MPTPNPQKPSPVRVPAPAKLNLFLHITGRRANGYHDLQTLFQFVDLKDYLYFHTTEEDQLSISAFKTNTRSQFSENIQEKDNLIFKAASALLPHKKVSTGIHIEYEKYIPSGAGLGGGSSDAATTLLTLNTLWECQLSNQDLCSIGLILGADVPVFVNGHAAFAEGVGENLSNISPKTPWYVIIKPDVHISTAEIFSHPDLTRNTPTLKISAALKQGGHNDCEKVVRTLYPEVDKAMVWLDQFSPSKLTGTGACIFAEFDDQEQAIAVANQYATPNAAFAVQGLNDNPAHRVLQELKL
jgi:4-diphosphocytidyl-2-C-methyl-D-erythritol kinase